MAGVMEPLRSSDLLVSSACQTDNPSVVEGESLFERFPWLYTVCREHLFRDDTERIVDALWPAGSPPKGAHVLELGCGPGFYACGLAARFAHLRITGVDRSARQLQRARGQAAARRLAHCRFVLGDGRALTCPAATFDAAISARLFTILRERERVLAELHRVLRPGGRLFIAEPRSARRAGAPLRAMWLMARLTDPRPAGGHGRYREPARIAVFTGDEFEELLASQPWARVRYWHDTRYHYALCDKRVE
jgi:arsenite methyltransferase